MFLGFIDIDDWVMNFCLSASYLQWQWEWNPILCFLWEERQYRNWYLEIHWRYRSKGKICSASSLTFNIKFRNIFQSADLYSFHFLHKGQLFLFLFHSWVQTSWNLWIQFGLFFPGSMKVKSSKQIGQLPYSFTE